MFHNSGAEEILESPLDSKEFKFVNSKVNQPWILIGRTDAEAWILWRPDVKSSSVQSLSHVQHFTTSQITAHQPPRPSPFPEFTQTHAHRVGDAIQPSHPLLSPSPAPNPPRIRVFSNESTLHMRWSKYWSFCFSMSPLNEHPGLISFRMDWLDPLAVQETLKSLLQHHSSKVSILQHPASF